MRLIYYFLFFTMMIIAIMSCDSDDAIDGPPPEIETIETEIFAAPGEEVQFEAIIVDENGITEIQLVNEELLLDKSITFANPAKKYFLDYKFMIEEDVQEKVYMVSLHVKNLASKTESWSINLDVASSPVLIGIPSTIDASPGDEVTIKGTIMDNNGLSSLRASALTLGIDENLELNGNPTNYDINYTFIVPAEAEKTTHKFTFTAVNIANRISEYTTEIVLTGEDIVYENIYTAGGFQWNPWNPSLAYPMEKDASDANWFVTTLPSWDGSDEIKFLGQLDWAPDNWGLVDGNDPSKGMINAENSATVKMPANGKSPAYYQVRFNPYDLQYELTELTEAKDPQAEMYIVGKGFTDYPDLNWSPEEAIPMTKNPNGMGEHIFVIEGLKFSDDVDIKFIGQNTGWGPYDAGFVNGGEMSAPISWAEIKEGDGSADLKFKEQAGSYTVMFDYYLGRALIWKE